MKATRIIHQSFRSIASVEARPIGLGISAVALFVQLGCVTRETIGVMPIGAPPLAEMIQLEPGSIGFLTTLTPARVSFAKSIGRTGYAADGAGYAARAVLDPPQLGDPIQEAGASVIGVGTAPIAAMVGGISVAHNRMPPEKLLECETNLARVMALMADQKHLRKQLFKTVSENSRRTVILLESMASGAISREPVSAIFETRVEELRLDRLGKSDASFALLIKTRARLIRASDGAVLCDQPFEYRSGTALFLDWTLSHAMQDVAETGYRELAERMVQDIFIAAPDTPVLAGAGFKKFPEKNSAANVRFVAGQQRLTPPARVQFASYETFGPGALGVYSTTANSPISLQRPLSKDEAVSEAVREVEWSLDGLDNSRNLVVQAAACAAAVPLSLWKQSAAAIQGLTEKQYRAADAALSAAARQTKPHRELAYQVARQLTPKTSQRVVLVQELPRGAARNNSGWMPVTGRGTPESVLEIHVISAGLKGGSGVNPALSLCVDAQAIWLRTSDGQELYSCPVHYRSRARKFIEWAGNNAQPFRQETDKYYRELGCGIVEQLESRGLIMPGQTPQTTIAENLN